MKQKNLFLASLETLLYSWGGDTPAEAVWGVNELLEWCEQEYNIKLNVRMKESFMDDFTENGTLYTEWQTVKQALTAKLP